MNYFSTQMYFEWSDETPVTYTKWLPGEPTHAVSGQEDCVVMAGEVKSSHLYCLIFISNHFMNQGIISGNYNFIHSEGCWMLDVLN